MTFADLAKKTWLIECRKAIVLSKSVMEWTFNSHYQYYRTISYE